MQHTYNIKQAKGMAGEPFEYIEFLIDDIRVTKDIWYRTAPPQTIKHITSIETKIGESNHLSAISFVE